MPIIFRRSDYPASSRRWIVLQEFMMQPLLICLGIYAVILLTLIAKHEPILFPGIGGVFVAAIVGNFLGTTRARAQYQEIGFYDNFFYMRSAYDIAYQKNLRYYPLPYANAVLKGNALVINYVDQTIELRGEQWEQWRDICELMLSAQPY